MSEAGVERRLTTILAADVVGHSRLMATDETETGWMKEQCSTTARCEALQRCPDAARPPVELDVVEGLRLAAVRVQE